MEEWYQIFVPIHNLCVSWSTRSRNLCIQTTCRIKACGLYCIEHPKIEYSFIYICYRESSAHIAEQYRTPDEGLIPDAA